MPKKKISTAVRREFAQLATTLANHDVVTTESRRERGLRRLTETVGLDGGEVLNDLVKTSPELTRFIVDFAYGDVIARDRLDARTRMLVVVASLASLGTAQPQLTTHIRSALNCGCTREEILEVLLVVAVYAGFPAAMNAMGAVRTALGGTSKKSERAKIHFAKPQRTR